VRSTIAVAFTGGGGVSEATTFSWSPPLIADRVSENPTTHEHLVASHPLGRMAEPEEVADVIVYLATSKSSYVTGVALPVDGGYLAR